MTCPVCGAVEARSPVGDWCNKCGWQSPCQCHGNFCKECLAHINKTRKASGMTLVSECCCGRFKLPSVGNQE
jgi:hypothetical protein